MLVHFYLREVGVFNLAATAQDMPRERRQVAGEAAALTQMGCAKVLEPGRD